MYYHWGLIYIKQSSAFQKCTVCLKKDCLQKQNNSINSKNIRAKFCVLIKLIMTKVILNPILIYTCTSSSSYVWHCFPKNELRAVCIHFINFKPHVEKKNQRNRHSPFPSANQFPSTQNILKQKKFLHHHVQKEPKWNLSLTDYLTWNTRVGKLWIIYTHQKFQ